MTTASSTIHLQITADFDISSNIFSNLEAQNTIHFLEETTQPSLKYIRNNTFQSIRGRDDDGAVLKLHSTYNVIIFNNTFSDVGFEDGNQQSGGAIYLNNQAN